MTEQEKKEKEEAEKMKDYVKIQGIDFHKDAGKLSLTEFKNTHKHLKIDLDKAHKQLSK